MRLRNLGLILVCAALTCGCAAEGNVDQTADRPGEAVVEPTFDGASGLWLRDGWPVPDPDAVFDRNAPVITASEARGLYVQCLNEMGWDAAIEPQSGGIEVHVPSGQHDAYQRDLRQCAVDNRIGVEPPPPYDDVLAKAEYATQQRLRDCLIEHGQSPPVLPSYQVFEDQLLTHGVVYSLYTEAGFEWEVRNAMMAVCPDPIDTFGYNW